MRASARLHHQSVSISEAGKSHLVITISGDDIEGARPALGIIPVVDRSGSMGMNNKLGIVSSALGYLAGYLCGDDEVGLVSFDTEIAVELEPQSASESGMTAFRHALERVSPRGGTDLAGGLAKGLELAGVTGRANPEMVVRVILLTDGLANSGMTDPDMIAAMVSDLPPNVSVSTIGVGHDCDHNLLGAIATHGGGSYGFVETAGQAPEVLGAEIGGLLNIDGSEVEIEISPKRSYVEIGKALGAISSKKGEKIRLKVGNIMAKSDRNFVFPVSFIPPSKKHARPVTIADVVITGKVDEADVRIEVKPKVHFVEEAGLVLRDHSLDSIIDLAELADAQELAEDLARKSKYSDAADILAKLNLRTSGANHLKSVVGAQYANRVDYESSQAFRTSSMSVLNSSASLTGSSAAFDSLVGRTIGTYTTKEQREVASATVNAVMSSGDSVAPGSSMRAVDMASSLSPGDSNWSQTISGNSVSGDATSGAGGTITEDGDDEPDD